MTAEPIRMEPPFDERIIWNLPWDDYHSRDWALNPSRMVYGFKSMRHLRYHESDEKPERNKLIGSATHAAVLEPDEFSKRFAVCHCTRRDGIKDYELWKWNNEGKTPINPSEYEESMRIADAVWANKEARELLDGARCECSVFTEDRGVQCRGRVDGLNDTVMFDLKTTADIEPHKFGGWCARLRYVERMACYRRWLRKRGQAVDDAKILAVESSPPHDVVIFPLHDIHLENAESRMVEILDRVKQCSKNDVWPGVGADGPVELYVPNWSMDEDELDYS